jgi:hypothetical protein
VKNHIRIFSINVRIYVYFSAIVDCKSIYVYFLYLTKYTYIFREELRILRVPNDDLLLKIDRKLTTGTAIQLSI